MENGNCVGILLKTVPNIKPYAYEELRAKCFSERCNNQQFDGYQADYLLEKDQIYTASASTLNPQEAKIEYSYGTRQFQNQMVQEECEGTLGIENIGGLKPCSRMQSVESIEKSTGSIVYPGPSDAYQHVQNAQTLALNGNTTKAMEEIGMALNIHPNYKLAMELQAKILESLASTTIEPSPSSAENSTPTANSTTIIEENTPNPEPHNAPFNRGSVPTAAPHEQTTEGQGWSLKDISTAAVSAVIAVITVGGIATYIYNKGSAIYREHFSKTEEPYSTFVFSGPNVEDTNLMGNGSRDTDPSEGAL